jgi:hypothetical protein
MIRNKFWDQDEESPVYELASWELGQIISIHATGMAKTTAASIADNKRRNPRRRKRR